MEKSNRISISDDLNKYDSFSDKNDFIEMTMWTNEEGFDISFKDKIISLTRGQIDAIYYLKMTLDNDLQ